MTGTAPLQSEGIRKIGRTIGGTHWQADVAREIDYSKSMVTRVLAGSRKADILFARGLRNVMLGKIEGLTALLNTEGLPHSKSTNTKAAQKMIGDALKLLRSET